MRNDSASNPFGRFEISQEQRHRFAVVGVIALCFVGAAEAAFAMYGPDSTDDLNSAKLEFTKLMGTTHTMKSGRALNSSLINLRLRLEQIQTTAM